MLSLLLIFLAVNHVVDRSAAVQQQHHHSAAAAAAADHDDESATKTFRIGTPFQPVNAQLYPCNSSEPWRSRQRWSFGIAGPNPITLVDGNAALQIQIPSPNLATTCPTSLNSSCWNLIVGPAEAALHFTLTGSQQLVVASGGLPEVQGLCAANSNLGTVSHSNNYLANVFLTECNLAGRWNVSVNGTIRAADGQCLDIGSAGSHGDLKFQFGLQPAAPLEKQAFRSAKFVSWGGSVIESHENSTARFHMFASVFGVSQQPLGQDLLHQYHFVSQQRVLAEREGIEFVDK
jgi:hypothetical protein